MYNNNYTSSIVIVENYIIGNNWKCIQCVLNIYNQSANVYRQNINIVARWKFIIYNCDNININISIILDKISIFI